MRAPTGFRRALLCCLLLGNVPASGADDARDLVFPPPPAETRLIYRGQISDPTAFAQSRSLLGKLTDWVTGGREDPQVGRPHGVALDGDILLAADPGAGIVHRFDLADSTWTRIPAKERFAHPVDAAAGPEGMVFVSDPEASQVAACDAKGRILFACDGPFTRPAGLVFDRERNRLIIADAAAHVLVLVGPDGRRLGTIGRRGAEPGEFNFPVDVALTPSGEILVLDALNFRVQVLDAEGNFRRSFGVHGDAPGHLSRPRGLCADTDGNILVTDALQDNFQIFDPMGRLLLAVGGSGQESGSFWMPAGIAAGPQGRIFVADAYNRRIQIFAAVTAPGTDRTQGGPER